ncbi:aldehyde dehydrogenase family protein [Streptomyces sp. 3212.3]|nr:MULTISPECIES: aldehyde dehydrogenase family protein [unclassified Streptomyces]REE58954.1 aldehyde dehydrogenase family protein [Streptomyces sp. 3212.3]
MRRSAPSRTETATFIKCRNWDPIRSKPMTFLPGSPNRASMCTCSVLLPGRSGGPSRCFVSSARRAGAAQLTAGHHGPYLPGAGRGRRGADRPVELPDRHPRLEAAAGADQRQRSGAEAGRAHLALHPPPHRNPGTGQAARPPGCSTWCTARARRSARPPGPRPRVGAVSFTGSTVVGMRIERAAQERRGRVRVEMGRKDVLVVLDDADVGQAAWDRRGGRLRRACSATSAYVSRSVPPVATCLCA